jgi:hypothetical protein
MFEAGFTLRNSAHMAVAIFVGEDITPLGTKPDPTCQNRKNARSGKIATASFFMLLMLNILFILFILYILLLFFIFTAASPIARLWTVSNQ